MILQVPVTVDWGTQQPWSVSQDGSSWRSCGRSLSFLHWLLGHSHHQTISVICQQVKVILPNSWTLNYRLANVIILLFLFMSGRRICHLQSTVKSSISDILLLDQCFCLNDMLMGHLIKEARPSFSSKTIREPSSSTQFLDLKANVNLHGNCVTQDTLYSQFNLVLIYFTIFAKTVIS